MEIPFWMIFAACVALGMVHWFAGVIAGVAVVVASFFGVVNGFVTNVLPAINGCLTGNDSIAPGSKSLPGSTVVTFRFNEGVVHLHGNVGCQLTASSSRTRFIDRLPRNRKLANIEMTKTSLRLREKYPGIAVAPEIGQPFKLLRLDNPRLLGVAGGLAPTAGALSALPRTASSSAISGLGLSGLQCLAFRVWTSGGASATVHTVKLIE